MAERAHNVARRQRLWSSPKRARWTLLATEAVKASALASSCSLADALGTGRYAEAVETRRAAMLALYDSGLTYEQIAVALLQDYSTVGYHIRIAREQFGVDTLFREYVRAARAAIALLDTPTPLRAVS